MSSSADREPPQDANPYRSPTHSGWADDPVALLQEFPGGAIEVRGSLQPKDVFLAHFNTSLGFTGFAISQLVGMAIATVLVLLFAAVAWPHVDSPVICAFLLVLVMGLLAVLWECRRNWMMVGHLKRLWKQRRGIFAEQVHRVTAHGISCRSADEELETPWTDYDYYQVSRHRLWLHLRQEALQRRRQRRPEGGILWKAGYSWFDGLDIFSRDQFASREQWQLFVGLVKELHRRW